MGIFFSGGLEFRIKYCLNKEKGEGIQVFRGRGNDFEKR